MALLTAAWRTKEVEIRELYLKNYNKVKAHRRTKGISTRYGRSLVAIKDGTFYHEIDTSRLPLTSSVHWKLSIYPKNRGSILHSFIIHIKAAHINSLCVNLMNCSSFYGWNATQITSVVANTLCQEMTGTAALQQIHTRTRLSKSYSNWYGNKFQNHYQIEFSSDIHYKMKLFQLC